MSLVSLNAAGALVEAAFAACLGEEPPSEGAITEVVNALRALANEAVTPQLLADTGLGKRARAIAGEAKKRDGLQAVEAAARAVVEAWKAAVTAQAAAAASAEPPTEEVVEEPAAKRVKAAVLKTTSSPAAPKREPIASTGDVGRDKLRELLSGALTVAGTHQLVHKSSPLNLIWYSV